MDLTFREDTLAVQDIDSHQFSPFFDVKIELEARGLENIQTLYVYSACLKAASKVWTKILEPGSGFLEPERVNIEPGRSVTRLPLDGVSIDSAIIFFNIIHYNFDTVGREVDFEELVDIAKLIDQFDCKAPFKLWAEFWLETLHQNQKHMYDIEWLFVGTVFKGYPHCEGICNMICRRLCRYTCTIGEREIVVCPGYDGPEIRNFDATLIPDQYFCKYSLILEV